MRQVDRTEPRDWFSLYLAQWGWLSMAAGVVMLVLTIYSVVHYRLSAAFADRGVAIVAEVVDRDIQYGDDRDTYYITFKFQPSGKSYAIKKKVSAAYYARQEIGSTARIYYLPEQPAKIETWRGETQSDAVLFQVLAAISGIGGCGMLWFSGQRTASAIRARRFGARVVAEVIGQEVVKDSEGSKTDQRHILWREPDGRRGKTFAHHKSYAAQWSVGDQIAVFHGRRESWWEGDVGPRELISRQIPKVPARPGE